MPSQPPRREEQGLACPRRAAQHQSCTFEPTAHVTQRDSLLRNRKDALAGEDVCRSPGHVGTQRFLRGTGNGPQRACTARATGSQPMPAPGARCTLLHVGAGSRFISRLHPGTMQRPTFRKGAVVIQLQGAVDAGEGTLASGAPVDEAATETGSVVSECAPARTTAPQPSACSLPTPTAAEAHGQDTGAAASWWQADMRDAASSHPAHASGFPGTRKPSLRHSQHPRAATPLRVSSVHHNRHV